MPFLEIDKIVPILKYLDCSGKFGKLWKILGSSRKFQNIPECFGKFYNVLESSNKFWKVLGNSRKFSTVLDLGFRPYGKFSRNFSRVLAKVILYSILGNVKFKLCK